MSVCTDSVTQWSHNTQSRQTRHVTYILSQSQLIHQRTVTHTHIHLYSHTQLMKHIHTFIKIYKWKVPLRHVSKIDLSTRKGATLRNEAHTWFIGTLYITTYMSALSWLKDLSALSWLKDSKVKVHNSKSIYHDKIFTFALLEKKRKTICKHRHHDSVQTVENYDISVNWKKNLQSLINQKKDNCK